MFEKIIIGKIIKSQAEFWQRLWRPVNLTFLKIEILNQLKDKSLTMVFNFHHAHEYVDEFPEIVKKMTPYLSYVNVSGGKKEGPEILSIGDGDHEYEMIENLLDEGYNGPWGVLGHIKTEDVQKVLTRNIKGLTLLNSQLKKEAVK